MTEVLKGKTALVTGGTSGVGKAIARGLAQRGANVIIVGRDSEKGIRAEREMRTASGNRAVEFLQADLSLVREARRLGEEVANGWRALHYLAHSAGIVRGRHVLTAEGFESNFATNYLSRFALTTCLLPSLARAGQPGESARVVLVAHPGLDGTIHYDDVNLTTKFSTIRAFRQFHYANDLFTVEFARRQPSAGQGARITISCLHPGPTKTNIGREMPLWMKLLVRRVVHPLFSHAPEVPAAAALKLLLADEFEGESGGLFTVIGRFKRVARSRSLADPHEGQRLWACSETLIRTVSDSATRTFLAVT